MSFGYFYRAQRAVHPRWATVWAVSPCSPVCQPTENCHLWLLVSDYYSVYQPIHRAEVLYFLYGIGGCCHTQVEEQLGWYFSWLQTAGNYLWLFWLLMFFMCCLNCNAYTQELRFMSQYSLTLRLGWGSEHALTYYFCPLGGSGERAANTTWVPWNCYAKLGSQLPVYRNMDVL